MVNSEQAEPTATRQAEPTATRQAEPAATRSVVYLDGILSAR